MALALSVGWELASFTVLGVGVGYWLDGHLNPRRERSWVRSLESCIGTIASSELSAFLKGGEGRRWKAPFVSVAGALFAGRIWAESPESKRAR